MQIPENMSGFARPKVNEASSFPPAGTGLERPAAEEQSVYEAFVNAANALIFNRESRASAEDIFAEDDPVKGVAMLAGVAGARAASAIYEQRKRPVPSEIIVAGMEEIVDSANQVSMKFGNPMLDEDQAMAALMSSVDQTRSALQGAGVIDEEDAKAEFEAAQGMSEQDILARFGG